MHCYNLYLYNFFYDKDTINRFHCIKYRIEIKIKLTLKLSNLIEIVAHAYESNIAGDEFLMNYVARYKFLWTEAF